LKQLQQVVGNTLEHVSIGNDFLSRTQKDQYLRERRNKWGYIKLKSFCTAKETFTRLKRQPTEWEKWYLVEIWEEEKGMETILPPKIN
jgi:hypothetical protein